jgi:hypothetical protein
MKLPIRQSNTKSLQLKIRAITEILCTVAKRERIQVVSLPLSPLAFPFWFIEQNASIVLKNHLTPWICLAGVDSTIFNTAKEIGLGKHLSKIEWYGHGKFTKNESSVSDIVKNALKTKQNITVKIGPNNIHDILDSLEH